MPSDDEKTPVRRPSAMRLERWGLVMDWLTQNDRRFYMGRVHPKRGHVVHVVNEYGTELVEVVRLEDDVSSAILRAIAQF